MVFSTGALMIAFCIWGAGSATRACSGYIRRMHARRLLNAGLPTMKYALISLNDLPSASATASANSRVIREESWLFRGGILGDMRHNPVPEVVTQGRQSHGVSQRRRHHLAWGVPIYRADQGADQVR